MNAPVREPRGMGLPARAWLWVVVVAALLSVTLNQTRPYVGDESYYQVSAIRMVQTGDVLVPVFAGAPRFQKPVLPYWMTAAGHAVFGVHLWSGRVGFLALACLLLWVTGAIAASTLRAPESATLAVMVLASFTPFIEHARVAVTDLPLTCFSMLSLYAFLRSTASLERARRWMFAGFAFAGLACASKGPLGVLPIAAFGLWLWRAKPDGYRRALGRLTNPVNLFPLVVLGFSWYGWVYWRCGGELARQFAVERAANVSAGLAHIPGHVLFYAGALLVYALPWLVFALVATWRRGTWKDAGRVERPPALGPAGWHLALLLLTIVLVLRRRDARYLLVVMPGLALYATACIQQHGWSGWARRAAAGMLILQVAFLVGYRAVCGEPLAALVQAWERQPAGALAEYRLPQREAGWLLALAHGQLERQPASARYVILDERVCGAFAETVPGAVRVIESARTLRAIEWRGWSPVRVYRTYVLVAAAP
jgi:4-amino-4-deoxy-L-arabinose transferase-like glycosyltransferase